MKLVILIAIGTFALAGCGKKTPLKAPGEQPDQTERAEILR